MVAVLLRMEAELPGVNLGLLLLRGPRLLDLGTRLPRRGDAGLVTTGAGGVLDTCHVVGGRGGEAGGLAGRARVE